jgi:THO complex subunit 7
MPTAILEGDGLDPAMNDSLDGGEELGLERLGESGEVMEKEDGEDNDDNDAVLLSASDSLNPAAKTFIPRISLSKGSDDDIEMGELAEDPKVKGKKKVRDEELEEGEASDSSSALSDPPDD